MNDGKVIDFQARLRARVSPEPEIDKQMELVFAALAELGKVIDSIRELGANNSQVARMLRHAADELERETDSEPPD